MAVLDGWRPCRPQGTAWNLGSVPLGHPKATLQEDLHVVYLSYALQRPHRAQDEGFPFFCCSVLGHRASSPSV